MKKAILAIFILIPIFSKAQAHLGSTLAEIKAMHTDKVFKIDYTKNNQKYASASMVYGTFVYYFDSETGLSNYCIQILNDMIALNTQVEIYNKKYVVISEKSWKAYLEGGGIINIKLIYDEDNKLYYFSYTN